MGRSVKDGWVRETGVGQRKMGGSANERWVGQGERWVGQPGIDGGSRKYGWVNQG